MTNAEYQKQYREKNSEKLKAYRKDYYTKNRQKFLDSAKKYRIEHPEEYAERSRKAGAKRRNNPDNFVDLMYRAMVDRSRKKGLEITVDRAYMESLIKKSKMICKLSGDEMTFQRNTPNLLSPDRKDSSKGYVKGNIQLVTKSVNVAKNKLTTKQFIAMCKAVAKNNT